MMNIPNESEKFKDTLTSLKMGLQESWRYFMTVIYIGDWFRKGNQFNIEARFLDLVRESCIRCSILTLAGFISNNKDSINFQYFLNIASDSLNLFQFSEKSKVEKSIEEHRNWLKALISDGVVGNRIIDKRDKIIAHLDRKFIAQKKPIFLDDNPPIDRDEIEDVYKQLMNIINEIESFYYDRLSVKNDLDLNIKEEVEYIFTLIDKRSQ